jgi:uncharacterized protein DUF6745
MLDKLTPAQERLCDKVFKEYDSVLDNLRAEPNLQHVAAGLKLLYDDKPVPAIEYAPSPAAALLRAKELSGVACTFDGCGLGDAGWISKYDYMHRIKILTDEEIKEVLTMRDFQRSVWDTILFEEIAIVVLFPTTLKRDADGNLHSATGPCIGWTDGTVDFAWHGVWVPERIITAPKSYTAAEYRAITDTEVRRALGEAAGWDHIVALLGAEVINTWTDPETDLAYELYSTADERWLRKQSPALQNGQQPYYYERVHENLKTAQAARKWQVLWDLTPEACEVDPVLTYAKET